MLVENILNLILKQYGYQVMDLSMSLGTTLEDLNITGMLEIKLVKPVIPLGKMLKVLKSICFPLIINQKYYNFNFIKFYYSSFCGCKDGNFIRFDAFARPTLKLDQKLITELKILSDFLTCNLSHFMEIANQGKGIYKMIESISIQDEKLGKQLQDLLFMLANPPKMS